MTTAECIAATPFQKRLLAFRRHANIVSAGGRGGGKSYALLLDLVDHVREDPEARPLVVRESWPALAELQDKAAELLRAVFGPRVTRNLQRGEVSCPNGALVTFSNLSDEAGWRKLQGRSFSALFADECGQYGPAAWRYLDLVQSNLRRPNGKRAHIHLTANPGGRGHAVIRRRWLLKSPPWRPFLDDQGRPWVWTSSTLEDNPHLDHDAYKAQLIAATAGDDLLAQAWIEGGWGEISGLMFADVLDERVHVVEPPPIQGNRYWTIIGADWGTSSPCAGVLVGRVSEPIGAYRTGDLFAFDETDTAVGSDLTRGSGVAPSTWGYMLRELAERNGFRRTPLIVQDDARGLSGETVCGELRALGLDAERPQEKNRIGGWTRIRALLQGAKARDERPGLFFSAKCERTLETLADAPRDLLRSEDLDPHWRADHWSDALSYACACLHGGPTVTWGRVKPLY